MADVPLLSGNLEVDIKSLNGELLNIRGKVENSIENIASPDERTRIYLLIGYIIGSFGQFVKYLESNEISPKRVLEYQQIPELKEPAPSLRMEKESIYYVNKALEQSEGGRLLKRLY